MKILYFDLSNGIRGDMTVAALLDLGADKNKLLCGLSRLDIFMQFSISISKVNREGIIATEFSVNVKDPQKQARQSYNYAQITAMVSNANLGAEAEDFALSIFEKIAVAESFVYGKELHDADLKNICSGHSIINIVGTSICLSALAADMIISSPINIGSIKEESIYEMLPTPASVTARLLAGVPTYSSRDNCLTTPIGAGIIKTIADYFGNMPDMTIAGIGYGAGKTGCMKVIMGERKDILYDFASCNTANIQNGRNGPVTIAENNCK
ncbi:MAG TPA: DUF111 family protein [Clostridia bacterium]|nr:DUF111 family protein [Clostridia bacterium]